MKKTPRLWRTYSSVVHQTLFIHILAEIWNESTVAHATLVAPSFLILPVACALVLLEQRSQAREALTKRKLLCSTGTSSSTATPAARTGYHLHFALAASADGGSGERRCIVAFSVELART